ncbi:hypothetical protein HYE82_07150 [Streptomyces sp. BR123]|nr:hypothetical protein [Streptomyces sp. BR123]
MAASGRSARGAPHPRAGGLKAELGRKPKTVLGLDHFEGRSFAGRHRHVTLLTAAHLF